MEKIHGQTAGNATSSLSGDTHPAACDSLDAPPNDESSVSNLEAPGATAQVESATEASLAIPSGQFICL